MSKPKPTPGPWTVEGPVVSSKSPSRHVLSKGFGYPAHAFGGSEAEVEANAHLIAAAPDLLKQLEQVLSSIESGDHLALFSAAAFDAISSAVHKARGGACK